MKDKIELHIIASRTDWSGHPIRIRTTHRGSDGKIRASTSKELRSGLDGTKKRRRLEKAIEQFIEMYNLFAEEII